MDKWVIIGILVLIILFLLWQLYEEREYGKFLEWMLEDKKEFIEFQKRDVQREKELWHLQRADRIIKRYFKKSLGINRDELPSASSSEDETSEDEQHDDED